MIDLHQLSSTACTLLGLTLRTGRQLHKALSSAAHAQKITLCFQQLPTPMPPYPTTGTQIAGTNLEHHSNGVLQTWSITRCMEFTVCLHGYLFAVPLQGVLRQAGRGDRYAHTPPCEIHTAYRLTGGLCVCVCVCVSVCVRVCVGTKGKFPRVRATPCERAGGTHEGCEHVYT
jgi:hypothetical protein